MQNNLAKKYPQNIEFADIDADHTVKAVYVPVDAPTKTVTDEAGNDLNGGTVRAGDTLVYTVTCCRYGTFNTDVSCLCGAVYAASVIWK